MAEAKVQERLNPELVLSGKEFIPNTLLTFTIDRDQLVIPDDTRDKVLKKLGFAWTKVAGNTYDTFPTIALRSDIDWTWLTDRGTLPKRIRSFMHKEHKFEVSDNILGQLGDICLKDLPKSQDYYFDVSTQLNWRSGDFGDHQSCFLNHDGSPGYTLKRMDDDGRFAALRFFRPFPKNDEVLNHSVGFDGVTYTKEDEIYMGVSRSWLFHTSEESTILFNSYGYNTSTSAEIFGRYLGIPKKEVSIEDTDLHINGDYGFIFSNSKEKAPDYVQMDFWENGYRNDGW